MQAILVRILRSRGAGYLSAVLGVAAVIAISMPLRDQLNNTTVALAVLLAVLFVATGWGEGQAWLLLRNPRPNRCAWPT